MTAQQLKNSILQLAVQGKLVPQDKSDEPASKLLKRIKAEKAQLIKDGKIKKEKPLPPITDEEIPFDIPDSWEWVKIDNITSIVTNRDGQIKSSEVLKQGLYPVVSQGQNIIDGYSNEDEKLYKVETPLIMFGDHTRNVKYIDFDFIVGADGTKILMPVCVNPKYVYYVVTFVANTLRNRGYARHFSLLKKCCFPIPPLAEQQRIIDKIEEYLPLIEAYDTAETQRNKLDEELPERLKKSILQQAVQGKLVPQDKSDEPASELLKRIKAEKLQLIKDGKIKKEKQLSPITSEEMPFDIPNSWEWARLGELCYKLTDGAHHTPKYITKGVPFLSVKDMSSGKLDFNNCKFISEEEHKELYKRCNPEKGDLLVTKIGTTGVPVIVDTEIEFSLFVSVALIKTNWRNINARFLCELIKSPLVFAQAKTNTKGVGNKNWVIKDIANTSLAIPPLAEQQRIVDKIEEYMSLIVMLQ